MCGRYALNISGDDLALEFAAANANAALTASNWNISPTTPIPFISSNELAGDSAGGNLASGVAIKDRDQGKLDVAYQLLIYPANSPSYVATPVVPNATGFGSTQAGIKWAWEQYLSSDSD
jgi:hypothetical protein